MAGCDILAGSALHEETDWQIGKKWPLSMVSFLRLSCAKDYKRLSVRSWREERTLHRILTPLH